MTCSRGRLPGEAGSGCRGSVDASGAVSDGVSKNSPWPFSLAKMPATASINAGGVLSMPLKLVTKSSQVVLGAYLLDPSILICTGDIACGGSLPTTATVNSVPEINSSINAGCL